MSHGETADQSQTRGPVFAKDWPAPAAWPGDPGWGTRPPPTAPAVVPRSSQHAPGQSSGTPTKKGTAGLGRLGNQGHQAVREAPGDRLLPQTPSGPSGAPARLRPARTLLGPRRPGPAPCGDLPRTPCPPNPQSLSPESCGSRSILPGPSLGSWPCLGSPVDIPPRLGPPEPSAPGRQRCFPPCFSTGASWPLPAPPGSAFPNHVRRS